MNERSLVVAAVAYTPRHSRPELFGSCQLRSETPRYVAA